jgi:hypothetical protein
MPSQNLPEAALTEGIQQVATKPHASLSPSLFNFRSPFAAIRCDSYYVLWGRFAYVIKDLAQSSPAAFLMPNEGDDGIRTRGLCRDS